MTTRPSVVARAQPVLAVRPALSAVAPAASNLTCRAVGIQNDLGSSI